MVMCCGTNAWKLACSSYPGSCRAATRLSLRASELAMLLDGIDMAKLKRVPRYERLPKDSIKTS